MPPPRPARVLLLAAAATAGAACTHTAFDPDRAVRPYPAHLQAPAPSLVEVDAVAAPRAVDIQVFRDDEWIEIVNSTARSYVDVDLWINQRYMRHVDRIGAGETVRLPLWEFFDERGESIKAGGFFRTDDPTPVRLVQIQTGPDDQLVGLITIRSEPAELRERRR